MLPQLDFTFAHIPLEGSVFPLDHDFEFPWYDSVRKLPLYNIEKNEALIHDDYSPSWTEDDRKAIPLSDWRYRQRKILSSCVQAYNPWSGVSRELRKRVDRGVPVSNAFCKMYEMCHVEEVRTLLNSHGNSGQQLNVTFLAEAPAMFPIAIMYYLGNHFPMLLGLNGFQYHCTTLPFDEEKALPDQFELMGANMSPWHFMDHTSSEDTRRMIITLGVGSMDMVTGDIGKGTPTWNTAERDIFREELGQFVAACALLKPNGLAILKMFSVREYSTACILRLAIGLFEQVRIFKPLTSRPSNIETYWIMKGFKRNLFDATPMLESLLQVMDDASVTLEETRKKFAGSADPELIVPHYRGFLSEDNFQPVLVDKILRVLTNQHLHNRAFLWQGVIELENWRCQKGEVFDIQVSIMRSLQRFTSPYVEGWLAMFPIDKLGAIIYKLTGIDPTKARRSHGGPKKEDKD